MGRRLAGREPARVAEGKEGRGHRRSACVERVLPEEGMETSMGELRQSREVLWLQ